MITTRPRAGRAAARLLVAVAVAAVATTALTGSAGADPPGGPAVPTAATATGASAGTGISVPVAGFQEIELTVPTADGLTLPATLRIPTEAAPGRPAMVMVHGAGTGQRDKYRFEAEAFTRAGVATLTYDKRSVGYSLTIRSYSQLADDAIAAAEVLRDQPGINRAEVGLWGVSEGGWVAPLAASRAPETAFLVVVGANGVSPLRQQTWAEALKMQAAGVRGSLVDAASAGTYRLINSMGMFPEPYYDPAPVLRGLRLPVLGIWGALDRATPPVESVAAFRAGLDLAGNTHYTLRTFDGAQHSLYTTVDGFVEGPDLTPGYPELIGEWTGAVATGAAPATSVTGTGDQPRPTADVPPSAWWESAPALGVWLGLMLLGFLGFALTAAIRRLHRLVRPGSAATSAAASDAAPVSARVVAGAGLVSAVGTLTYIVVLTMTRGGHAIDPGPMLAGRTLPWLALQALAVTTVVATVVLVIGLVRGRPDPVLDPDPGPGVLAPAGRGPGTVRRPTPTTRSAGERVRLTMLLVAAAAFVPWAAYWGLLIP